MGTRLRRPVAANLTAELLHRRDQRAGELAGATARKAPADGMSQQAQREGDACAARPPGSRSAWIVELDSHAVAR